MWISIITCCLYVAFARLETERACADYNYAAAAATMAGLDHVYVCPHDNIHQHHCKEKFPLKDPIDIKKSSINLHDLLFYMMVGPKSRLNVLKWWIRFLKKGAEIVLISDYCPDDVTSIDNSKVGYNNGQSTCLINLNATIAELTEVNKRVRYHIVHVLKNDIGYNRLSCKLRTGIKAIYNKFPNKKYYFKIDTDTIVFPTRLIHFINVLDAVHNNNKSYQTESQNNDDRDIHGGKGLYFGTVVESGMNLLLCGRDWKNTGNVQKGGLCYAQGGAGYGLNNVAMKTLSEAHECSQVNNIDDATAIQDEYLITGYEDVFVGIMMWKMLNITVIHCSGFRSSELIDEMKAKQAITFHYIDENWLKGNGDNLVNNYNKYLSVS